MAQSTKTPGDQRYSDESLDPYQQEWDALMSRPDMQALDDQAEAGARAHGSDDDKSGGVFDKLSNRREKQLDDKHDAAAARRAAEKKEWDDAASLMNDSPKDDQKSNQKTGRSRGVFNKKNALRGGIAGGTVGLALVVFGFLSPLKLPGLMQAVTNITGQRVEQITTHRAKVIMARAILSKFGYVDGVVVTGKGPVSSLIATLRTNRFEDKLKAKGLEIIAGDGGVRLKMNGNFIANGNLLKSDKVVLAALENDRLTYKLVNDIVKEEIPTWRWMKRAKFAAWLRLKYNIHRFGTKKTTETDREAKLADIQEDRLTNRYGQYADNLSEAIGCVLGEPGCPVNDPSKDSYLGRLRDKIATKASTVKASLKATVQEQTKIIVNDATKSFMAKINEQLEKLLIKKFAVKAIPIVGWIDLAATIDHIAYNAVENDYIAAIPSHYRALSYAQMYGEWVGYGDQVKAGAMDNDVNGMLTSQLAGAETAQAFNYIMGDASRGVPVKIRVDENNPSAVKQAWDYFKGTPGGLYYRYISHPALDTYYNTIGGNGLLGALGDLVGGAMASFFSFITPDKVEEYFSKYMSEIFGKLFTVIGMAADPLDTGADLFNDIYAGGDVSFNTYCKELGCRKLTDAQVVTQHKSIAMERAQDLKDKGWAYALFSPDATNSVTNQLAMSLPSSITLGNLSSGVGQLASIVTNTPGRLLGTTTKADQEYVNLNRVYNYGALPSDLANPLAEEAVSGDECPAVAEDDYNNCVIDKTVAEAMACNLDTENPACNFMNTAGLNGAGGQFRLATFNLLGAGHTSDSNAISRLERSLAIMRNNNFDIVGLQEVDELQYDEIMKLGAEYDIYPKGDYGTRSGHRNAIIWKKDKFTRDEAASGTKPFKYFDGKDEQYPYVKLMDNSTKQTFVVFNTHDPTSSDTRGNQSKWRVEDARTHLKDMEAMQASGTPTFMTGDFNSAFVIRHPEDNGLSRDELTYCIMTSTGTVSNAYDVFHKKTGRCPTTGVNERGSKIDHIYMSTGVQVSNWQKIIDVNNATDHPVVFADIVIPGGGDAAPGGRGDVTASGFAWPLGSNNWQNHRANFLASHYSSGGFLGNGRSSVDISWGGIAGTQVYAMLGGTITTQPLGRTGRQCSGTPNGDNNGGMIITSRIGGDTVQIAYAHGDNIMAGLNKTVKAGDPIMDVGNVGNSCGAHLHMNVTVNNRNICPQDLFLAMARGGEINLTELAERATPTCGGRG